LSPADDGCHPDCVARSGRIDEAAMPLTLPELKSHLWNCAEILRGSAVDRTDWKAYILPLLFFKRICDVWDEETAEAAVLFGDVDPVDFPEVHRFVVTESFHLHVPPTHPSKMAEPVQAALRVRFRKRRARVVCRQTGGRHGAAAVQ
jgi:hypothetical protein